MPRPGKRHRAREMAMQMLYQAEMGRSALPQIFRDFDLHELVADDAPPEGVAAPDGGIAPATGEVREKAAKADLGEKVDLVGKDAKAAGKKPTPAEQARVRQRVEDAFAYAQRLVEGTRQNQDSIDSLIEEQAENWRLERMPPVDRNILRLAVYELLHEVDVPKLVIVDEAIELAKRFGSENSGRFVNGLLDGLLRSKRLPPRSGE